MDRPPAPAALWIQWRSPGDASYADVLAPVLLRQGNRLAMGGTRPAVVWAALGFVALVIGVATWPVGMALPIGLGLLAFYMKFRNPKHYANILRDRPTSHDPYTVTLDVEGFHVVSPNVADHLRWRLFEHVEVDEDCLVLRRREHKLVQVVPLAPLDPSVDRAWLVAAVQQAIEADAPPA